MEVQDDTLEEQVAQTFDDDVSTSPSFLPELSDFKQSSTINHLVVLVHGLHGSKTDLHSIRKSLSAKHKNVYVHCAESNDGFLKTHAGIDEGGKNIAKEIEDLTAKLIRQGYPISKFSIIGHSLGGLYSRYCIGVLFEKQYFQKYSPVVCIIPQNPINLGRILSHSQHHMWVLEGHLDMHLIKFYKDCLADIAGRQLMLEDSSSYPLLLKMSRAGEVFYQALTLFKHRVLYSNISWDFQVPYTTSAIVNRNPYSNSPKYVRRQLCSEQRRQPKLKETHPHIVESESAHQNTESELEKELFANDSKKEFLTEILNSLQTLEWKRVDIFLENAMAHEMIIAKRKWVPNNGTDIVEHLADVFQNIHEHNAVGHQS